MPSPRKFVIDEAAFRDLVDGRTVTLMTRDGHQIQAVLADIGFTRMLQAIAAARGVAPTAVQWKDPDDDYY
jgi:hypothetical protein